MTKYVALLLLAPFSLLGQSDSSYEELPELKASEILRPEILNGSHHKVQEPVPTFSGWNHFSIDSDFGAFEAKGNEMLIRRVNEITAISELRDVSRTEQYKNALVKAAKSPLVAVKNFPEWSRRGCARNWRAADFMCRTDYPLGRYVDESTQDPGDSASGGNFRGQVCNRCCRFGHLALTGKSWRHDEHC